MNKCHCMRAGTRGTKFHASLFLVAESYLWRFSCERNLMMSNVRVTTDFFHIRYLFVMNFYRLLYGTELYSPLPFSWVFLKIISGLKSYCTLMDNQTLICADNTSLISLRNSSFPSGKTNLILLWET